MPANGSCERDGGVEQREIKGRWTRRVAGGKGMAGKKKEVCTMKYKSVGQAPQADGLKGAQQDRKSVVGAVQPGGWAPWGSWAWPMPWAFHEQTKRHGQPAGHQHKQRSCGGKA